MQYNSLTGEDSKSMSKLFTIVLTLFLVSVLAVGSYADLDYAIKLKTGDLHPDRIKSTPSLATALQGKHILVQFDEPLTDLDRQGLADQGLVLLDYVPNYAYTARLDQLPDQAAFDRYGIRWMGPIQPDQKISPYITNIGIADWARRDNGTVQFSIVFHPDEDIDQWGAWMKTELGADIVGYDNIGNSIDLVLPEVAYYRLAVLWIEQALPPPHENNDSNRANTGAETVQAPPLSLTGLGVMLAEWDGGRADGSHLDFGGRIIAGDNASISTHATHVAGTVLGSGASRADRRYRGMAPEAQLVSQLWWQSSSELSGEYSNVIGSWGASIATNSWGYSAGDPVSQASCESTMGNYWSVCTTIDNVVRGAAGAPITIVWSAGNERGNAPSYCGYIGWTYNTVTPLPTSKNVIAIGAVNSNNSSMTSFSSWGPTDDGRIKPDVTAPGCQSNGDYGVTSCRPGSGYTTMCGTSQAAPTAAGVLALMKEQWDNQIGAGTLLPSTMKGILINTATDLGNPGPDYQYGNGNINAVAAVTKIGIGEPSYLQNEISTDGIHVYDLTVPGGASKLKVTLVWDDPGGIVSTSQNLKNDLDLVLIDPFGSEEDPWILDPSRPSNSATRGVDRLNNVETVEINNPTPGLWKAKVTGYNIPVGPQAYSLVFTPDSINTPGNLRALAVFDAGDVEQQPGTPGTIDFWVTNIGAALDSVQVQVSDSAGWLDAELDTSVYLNPYDSAHIVVTGTVPAPALAGEYDAIHCSAVSKSDGLVTADNTIKLVASAYYIVTLSQNVPLDTVLSPDTYSFDITIKNDGNAVDEMFTKPSGGDAWSFVPSFKFTTLQPGHDTTVTFVANVPAELVHLAQNEVTVTSTSDGGATDTTSFFLVSYNPLHPPSLVSPEPASYVQDGTPDFSWDGTGDSYTLYIATDQDVTNIVQSYAGLLQASFTVPSGDSLADGTYYWAVRQYLGTDSSSLQRYPGRLGIDNQPPIGMHPTIPSNGAYTRDQQMQLNFTNDSGTLPPTVAPEYNILQLSQDSLFETDVTSIELASLQLSYDPVDPLALGRWYLRVQRADSAGNFAPFSSAYWLVVDTEPPSVPTLLSPDSGASVADSTVVLRWTTGDNPPYAMAPEYFYLHVSKTENFSDWGTFANFIYQDSLVMDSLLTAGQTYYWRVKAYDSAGFYSDYSTSSNFTWEAATCGDLTDDGIINLADITFLIAYIYLGGPAPSPIWIGSVNCDDVYNLQDVTALIDHIYLSKSPVCCSPF